MDFRLEIDIEDSKTNEKIGYIRSYAANSFKELIFYPNPKYSYFTPEQLAEILDKMNSL